MVMHSTRHFREGWPSWRKGPKGTQAQRSGLQSRTPCNLYATVLICNQKNKNKEERLSTALFGGLVYSKGSCRVLCTEDHVLAGLSEQSEACLPSQFPLAQLVQVPDILPLGGDAASYLEQRF